MAGTLDFNGADTSPLGAPWSTPTGWNPLRQVSNQAANAAGTDDNAAMRRTDSTATRSIVEYQSGTFDGGPAFLNSSGSGYVTTLYSGGHLELFKVTAGPNYERVGDNHTVTFTAGDEIEIDITDPDDLVFLKNGVEFGRETDTSFRAGLTPALFMFSGDLRVDNHSDGATGGQNIDVGLSTESDSAFSVGKIKIRLVGLNTESDTAFVVSMIRTFDIGLATETDSAFSIGKTKSKVVGLNTETDSTLSVTPVGDLPTFYSTDFPDTENPINQGGMFRAGSETGFYKNARSTPGKCFAADFVGAGFDDCLAQLQNHAIPADHRVSVALFKQGGYTPGDTHEVGIYGRMVIGEEFVRGYEVLIDFGPTSFSVVKWKGVDITFPENFEILDTSGSPAAVSNGDVFTAEFETIDGNCEIRCYRNGVLFNTTVDEDDPWLDGNPGLGFFVRETGNTPENYCITSWEAGAIEDTLVAVGLTEETDSAFSIDKKKLRGVGLTTETNTVLVLARGKSKVLGLTAETCSAFTLAHRKSRVLGLALEANTAFSIEGGENTSAGGYRGTRLGLGLG